MYFKLFCIWIIIRDSAPGPPKAYYCPFKSEDISYETPPVGVCRAVGRGVYKARAEVLRLPAARLLLAACVLCLSNPSGVNILYERKASET